MWSVFVTTSTEILMRIRSFKHWSYETVHNINFDSVLTYFPDERT